MTAIASGVSLLGLISFRGLIFFEAILTAVSDNTVALTRHQAPGIYTVRLALGWLIDVPESLLWYRVAEAWWITEKAFFGCGRKGAVRRRGTCTAEVRTRNHLAN